MGITPLLPPAGIAQLTEALTGADYTADGITRRLGEAATTAMRHGDPRAAIRAATSDDALDTLIRLFGCGLTVPETAVTAALAPLPLADALAAGILDRADGGLRTEVELQPYESAWVLADVPTMLRRGPVRPDHVLGIGGASRTLALATLREPVRTALDLGTGCGVQALHLSEHAAHVTATDLSERALRFAATNAALAGRDWELLAGDLTAPVAGRRFDLVVSNPPFVTGPAVAAYTYRDSGRAGDAVAEQLVAAAPDLLTEGGHLQFLANWLHVSGADWRERVAGWVAGTGLDAWVIQRDVSEPAAYVDLWLADAGGAGDRDAWLDWFDEHKVEAIGFGIVTLRRSERDDPVVRVEDLRQPVDQPFGPSIRDWFTRVDWLREQTPRDILAARFSAAAGPRRTTRRCSPGPGGWR